MAKLLKAYSTPGISLSERRFIFRWFILGLALHLVMSWFSLGFYHYDEHFQILEFAGYKAGLMDPSLLQWEFRAQIRATFQPYIAFIIIKLLQSLHSYDPYIVATILRLLSAVIGWGSALLMTFAGLAYISNTWLRKFFIIISCVLAPLIFVHVRFSGEGWSGSLVFAGMAIVILLIQNGKQQIKNESAWLFLIAGLLMGLAYICRFQTCIIVGVFFLWLIFMAKLPIKKLLWIGSGVAFAIIAGAVLDRLFYGEWVNTAYRYYYFNIVLGIAAQFGKQPWWWYLKEVLNNDFFFLAIPMMILVSISFFTRWKNPFVWVSAFFLIVHFAISHKEFRFLFPLIDGLPLLIIFGLDGLYNFFSIKLNINKISTYIIFPVFVILNTFSILSSCFSPTCSYLYAMRYIYLRHKEPSHVLISNLYISKYTKGGLRLHFYNNKETDFIYLNTNNTDSVMELAKVSKSPILIMQWTKGLNTDKSFGGLSTSYQEEYETFPRWLHMVNFNHWIDRTSSWKVYKIKV